MLESFPVVLTAEDFALLQNIADLPTEPFPGAIEVVRRKLAATNVVFPADVIDDVVTLNSRVRFSVNNGSVDARVLVGGPIEDVYDRTLPLTSPEGLR